MKENMTHLRYQVLKLGLQSDQYSPLQQDYRNRISRESFEQSNNIEKIDVRSYYKTIK